MYRKTAVLLFLAAASLCACQRAPDADYLRDYTQAHDLIDAYRGGSELVRAQRLIDELLLRRPDLPHAHVEKARVLMKQGHIVGDRFRPGVLQNTEQELRSALALDSRFCDGHIVLGYVLSLEQRYPEALEALDRADSLACPSPWRLMNRVDVDIALQHFDDAKATLDQVPPTLAGVSPTLRATIEGRVLKDRAWIAYCEGDRDAMLGYVRDQLKAAPAGDAWAVGNTVASFTRAGAFDEAIDAAHEALRRMHYRAAEESLGTALFGKALWQSSRPGAQTDPRSTAEWAEAETLASFGDAGKELWGSLANHDAAFRALLQAKIAEDRATQSAGESQP